MFSYALPMRMNAEVESMLQTSFCAVPAFMRVLPMSTSGPTTGQMATSTSSVNSSRAVIGAVLRALHRPHHGGVAAGDHAHDHVGVGAERGWALGGVQHAEPAA